MAAIWIGKEDRADIFLTEKGFCHYGVILGSFPLSWGSFSRLHGGQLQLVVSVGGKEVYRQWWDRGKPVD